MNLKWRALTVVAWSVLVLLIFEVALQVRSHLRFGQSVLNALTAETTYVVSPDTGLKTLRPNAVIRGTQAVLQTNSFGLRDKEIALEKPPGTLRIAILGASSVMGAYARTNNDTLAKLLEDELRNQWPEKKIEVMNGGIAGYGLVEEAMLLEKLLSRFKPDLVIAYTGFNDFVSYCKRGAKKPITQAFVAQGLPKLTLPSWLLTVDMLLKNTASLRAAPVTKGRFIDPQSIDMTEYIEDLSTLARTAKRRDIPLVMATNARAYLPGQPREMQDRLSATARYYNYCFDVNGLNQLYDMHNDAILRLKTGYAPIDLATIVPGGPKYFADATHFSSEGKRLVANSLARWVMDNKTAFSP